MKQVQARAKAWQSVNSHIAAYLIGVSHADIALVLAGHVAVDGINIFGADQLVHYNVSPQTEADEKITVHTEHKPT